MSYSESILDLKNAYSRMRWYQKLFFPGQLALALTNYPEQYATNEDSFNIFNTFISNTRGFQRNFIPSLKRFYQSPYTTVLRSLNNKGLLRGVQGQDNFIAVIAHQRPQLLASALHLLRYTGLLRGNRNQANFVRLVTYQDPKNLVRALQVLSNTDLLRGYQAHANFCAVIAHQRPQGVGVARAIIALNNTSLLSGVQAQANFNTVIRHQQPQFLARALQVLSNTDLLRGYQAQANFNTVIRHQQPQFLARVIKALRYTGLLRGNQAQTNFAAIVAHQDPQILTQTINTLRFTDLLRGYQAQANFNALITHATILCHRNNHLNRVSVWEMMPYQRPTLMEFQRMIMIAREYSENPDDGSAALMNYIHTDILNMFNYRLPIYHQMNNMQGANFNPNQSTHTTSVHASVSESAIKLKERYHNNIAGHALNDNINALTRWIHAHQPKNNKQKAAVRCIERLTNTSYSYTDRTSTVSTRQLLGLVWSGIHDINARLGTLEDAKNQLIEGLYEIQRGYNISNEGIDNNKPDVSICAAGTFNKLIEKLAGVHCDVSVRYITKEVASAKLKIVAIEQAQKYLDNLPLDEDIDTLKDKINAEDMDYLWSKILSKVKVRMFEEFSSLYPGGIDSDSFNNDVYHGIYALTSDVLKLSITPSVCSNHNTFFESKENDSDDDSKKSEDLIKARHP